MSGRSRVHNSPYDNPHGNDGLSERDSLALEPQKNCMGHMLPSQGRRKSKRAEQNGYKIIWAVSITIILLFIVLLVVFVPRRKSDGESKSVSDNIFDLSDPSVEAPIIPSRLELMRNIVLSISDKDALYNNTTSEYAALEWLAKDDPAFLDLDSVEHDIILDRYKIVLLYFATSGDNWRTSHNFLNASNICDWNDGGEGGAFEGVRCRDGEVVEVILDMNSLEGTIPTEISLFNLESLGLGANSIEGTIPTEVGTMNNLQWLSLSGNKLVGTLPSELGNLQSLKGLFVYNNKLSGTIPDSFEDLLNLELVFLEGNSFTGNLDVALCDGREPYDYFYADCQEGEVICSCCTHCCQSNGQGCKKYQIDITFPDQTTEVPNATSAGI